MRELKEKWMRNAAEAASSVESWLDEKRGGGAEESGFRKLAKWMLSGAVSPWEYMPAEDADFLDNPFEAARVLAKIHHALCDDGDVSFVRLSAEGKALRCFMVFAHPSDSWFAGSCEKECGELIRAQIRGRESLARAWEAAPARAGKGAPKRLAREDFAFEDLGRDPVGFFLEVERFAEQRKAEMEALSDRLRKFKSGGGKRS